MGLASRQKGGQRARFSGAGELWQAFGLRPQPLQVGGLALLLLVSIGLQLLNPQVMRQFVDRAMSGASDRTLMIAAGLFLFIALIQQVASVGATYLSERVGWTATNALRAELLRHCLRLDPSFHKQHTPGELIERIDGDATALAGFFSRLVIQVAGNLLLLLGVLVLLWVIDWRVGLLLTGSAGLVFLALHRIRVVVSPLWKEARQQSAELYGFIEERLAGAEDIRSSGAQAYTVRRLCERMEAQFRVEHRARLTGWLSWPTADFLLTLALASIYLLGASAFHEGSLSLGTLLSIFFYVELLSRPLNQISRQAEEFQKASAGIARIRELLDSPSALDEGENETLPAGPLAVTFRDVRFGYDADDAPVLDGISFDLEPGRVLGLLGRTGSGKSTIARLLFRLYDPQAGSIALGGVDLRRASLAALRQRVGVVTQEVQLFHATIRENLTLFDPAIPDGRIHAAIEALGLQGWFGSLPEGLDTLLAAGGGGLSAGEAQLLAFTRIFLRDPGLVILDEASSRLDPATEQLIERAVGRLLRGRTGIIIAHRLHTVTVADEILILEGGAALEHGERERLLGEPGSHFSRLLRTGLAEALV
jgi:ABC-type multidrug transport system fused ATPase/permease subunit